MKYTETDYELPFSKVLEALKTTSGSKARLATWAEGVYIELVSIVGRSKLDKNLFSVTGIVHVKPDYPTLNWKAHSLELLAEEWKLLTPENNFNHVSTVL